MEQISWSVLEYEQKPHSVDWYWTVGIITLIIVVACIYFKNYLLGLLIFVGVGTLVYLTIRKPETVTITIDEKGIYIRNELYPYRKIKAFWVEEEAQHDGSQHLLVMTNRTYAPLIAIPLGDMSPEKIRRALQPHAKETEMTENVSHRFIEMLGF